MKIMEEAESPSPDADGRRAGRERTTRRRCPLGTARHPVFVVRDDHATCRPLVRSRPRSDLSRLCHRDSGRARRRRHLTPRFTRVEDAIGPTPWQAIGEARPIVLSFQQAKFLAPSVEPTEGTHRPTRSETAGRRRETNDDQSAARLPFRRPLLCPGAALHAARAPGARPGHWRHLGHLQHRAGRDAQAAAVPQPERIVVVWENNQQRNRPRNVISAANWLEWRARNRSFTELGIAGPARLTLTVDGRPEEIAGLVASSHVFPVLGVQTRPGPRVHRGRGHRRQRSGARHHARVLAGAAWRPCRRARLDHHRRRSARVDHRRDGAGLLADGADGLVPDALRMDPGAAPHGAGPRLVVRSGAAPRRGELRAGRRMTCGPLPRRSSQEVPGRNAGWSVTLVPIHEQMVDQIRPALQVLSGAVALVLLIACVNVANLLLARSTVREQEIGLRAAFGAKRSRLVRQMLSESVLLSLMGAAGRARAGARLPSRVARAGGGSHPDPAAGPGGAGPARSSASRWPSRSAPRCSSASCRRCWPLDRRTRPCATAAGMAARSARDARSARWSSSRSPSPWCCWRAPVCSSAASCGCRPWIQGSAPRA